MSLQSLNSLLEWGLSLTSDSTTGFFSVTSTLDGEHRGDSPAASQNILSVSPLKSARLSSLSVRYIPLDYSHFCSPWLLLSVSIYRQVLQQESSKFTFYSVSRADSTVPSFTQTFYSSVQYKLKDVFVHAQIVPLINSQVFLETNGV